MRTAIPAAAKDAAGVEFKSPRNEAEAPPPSARGCCSSRRPLLVRCLRECSLDRLPVELGGGGGAVRMHGEPRHDATTWFRA